jgi:hypothetical protein
MPIFRFATSHRRRSALAYAYSAIRRLVPACKWPAFVAALWSSYKCRSVWTGLRRRARRGALALALVGLTGCSELARSSETVPTGSEPPYGALAAKYLQSTLVNRMTYDSFEISGVRWVDSIRGWSWLTCVHFQDHGHLRTYALFIQNNIVIDGRYAVETDACESQSYTPFDLMSGVIGRPTAPVQPPLY